MRNDVLCPYCSEEQEICHDDGYGYEEDELHQQECSKCNKTFTFVTNISFYYDAFKADCLNDSPHKYEETVTIPRIATRLQCTVCGDKKHISKERREELAKEW